MDRQRVIETNRSLRLIKNASSRRRLLFRTPTPTNTRPQELESLLEKNIITDSAFDSIHSLLPAESPLAGPTRSNNPTPVPAAAAAALPSPAPSTSPAPRHTPNPAPPSYAQSTASPPNLPQRNPPPQAPAPQKPVLAHARALYRYAASDARDCSFDKDDRLAIYEYMNADWWMGRNLRTGGEGIFPRSYVVVDQAEKAAPMPVPGAYHQPQYAATPGPVPVAGGGYPLAPPPGPAAQPYQQQPQQQEQEGSKVGEHGKKFGKKLGNAAIFGAGATIGSNIVNSIF
jgi:hypothetical protein